MAAEGSRIALTDFDREERRTTSLPRMRLADNRTAPEPDSAQPARRKRRRSLVFSLMLLLAAFSAVPVLIYRQFAAADGDLRALVLRAAEEEALLVAAALRPQLQSFTPSAAVLLQRDVDDLTSPRRALRVVLGARLPRAPPDSPEVLALVAASPPAPDAEFAEIRDRLEALGADSGTQPCAGSSPLGVRMNSDADQVLTAVVLVNSNAGCWRLLLGWRDEAALGSTLGVPFWRTPALQAAAGVYLLLAALVLILFLGVRRDLLRFGRLARAMREGRAAPSFTEVNELRELHGVAAELDRMVATLGASAALIRETAEASLHALKTPVATLSQLLEPLRRAVPEDNTAGQTAIAAMETSLKRIDGQLAQGRRLDQLIADQLDAQRIPLDLSDLVQELADDMRPALLLRGRQLRIAAEPGIRVMGVESLIEAVLAALVENAADFAPEGGRVEVTVARAGQTALLIVEDNGPGVPPSDLPHLFEAGYSRRGAESEVAHAGLGLSIVARSVAAMDGEVRAENRPLGGLRMTVRLPVV